MGLQDLNDIPPQLSYIYIAALQSTVQMPHGGDDICLPRAGHHPSAGRRAANALFCRKVAAVCPGFPSPQEMVETDVKEKRPTEEERWANDAEEEREAES